MFNIGNIQIASKVLLAPMAGVSNPAYMKICEQMGVGYVVTELISSEGIVRGNKKTLDMLNGLEELTIPYGIQIFGSDAQTMANAAKIINERYPKAIIDLNFGCPVPKVAIRAHSGSALLKEPDKLYDIVKSVVDAVNVPVTVKIRSGWDAKNINCVEIAKLCEKAGASAICLHARTREQGYSGQANWDLIKDVVNAVKIPVIGNGDVKNGKDALEMITMTGCTAVMIGRGALGNPWIFRDANAYIKGQPLSEITPVEKIEMIKIHYSHLLNYTNEKRALLDIRTHALWYIKGLKDNTEIKVKICSCKSSEELMNILDEYIKKLK